MLFFRPLPWEYAIRNLFRRPARTLLTLAGLTTVIVLVFVVVGFIRGLESSLNTSGDPRVALVFSRGMGENLEYSSIPMKTADLVPASVEGIEQLYGKKYVSPELYLGTQIMAGDSLTPSFGLVRGVTPGVLLVRNRVELLQGDWPQVNEVMIGRLAATKLGLETGGLQVNDYLTFENRRWRISGIYSAGGSVFESEVWCRLDDLQQAMKRQDLSLVAMTVAPDGDYSEIDLFCSSRYELDLMAMQEMEYYRGLQKHYGPVRMLAWLVVGLVSAAGVFAGLNTMYGAVLGRIPEIASLQTIGFVRRAVVMSLIQEGLLLAAAASLLASAIAFALVNGAAIRFTMGAFELRIDNMAILIGCGTGLLLGCLGSIPPAIRAARLPIVDGLKTM